MRVLLIPELGYLHALQSVLRVRLRPDERNQDRADRGAMSAEAMIIIGILVVTAVTALGIIASKIIAKARSIDLG